LIKIRYIEYQIVIGCGPPGLITEDIRELANPEDYVSYEGAPKEEVDNSIWQEGQVIHHLSRSSYVWNFSLVYKAGNFDVIKWKTAFAWKVKSEEEILMEKALFIGASAGVFFIMIDEDIDENFTKLADMMDVFIEKTKHDAPFLVYGVIENKEKIAELKTDKDMLKNLADVKKWVLQHGGEFRLDNLKELKMNLTHLINEYSHFILTKVTAKTNYPNLELGEVHFIDYDDLAALKEIEEALSKQVKAGQTVDHLLSELFFSYLERAEFQEEVYVPPVEEEVEAEVKVEEEVIKPPPSKIKIILEEIRKGIRRQCPKCFNYDRTKIREAIDKENIIMENPNIYGFKYICGMCGNEWRTQKDWKIEKS